MEPILFSKTLTKAKTPEKATEKSTGWDLFSAEEEDSILNSNQIKKIQTGIRVYNKIPNCYMHIYGRSGLAQKGIQIHPGKFSS